MRRRAGREVYKAVGGSGVFVPLVESERLIGLDRDFRQCWHFPNSIEGLCAGIGTSRAISTLWK